MLVLSRPRLVRKAAGTYDPSDARHVGRTTVRNERAVAQTIRNALTYLTGEIDVEALQRAMAVADPGRFIGSLPWAEFSQRLSTTEARLLAQVNSTGTAEMTALRPIIGATQFAVSDPRAVAWASTQSGRFVVGVSDEVRESVRQIITDSYLRQYDYRTAADAISRQVGLHPRWASAVEGQHQRNLARFIADGMDPTDAEAKAGRLSSAYRDRLVQSRAMTIARTEISMASNQGRLLSWQQAAERGLVDLSASTKQWLAEPDACPVCAEIAGEEVTADGDFSIGVAMPPAHPNCKCAAILLPTRPAGAPDVAADGEDVNPEAAAAKEDVPAGPGGARFQSDDPAEIAAHWESQIVDIAALNGQQSPLAGAGDEQLQAIAEAQGFVGLPRVVSSEEFDGLGDSHDTVWRGVKGSDAGARVEATSSELADQFKGGEYWPGFGMDGSGTYVAADSLYSAGNYSRLVETTPGQYAYDGLMRIGMPTDARMISEEDVWNLQRELRRHTRDIQDDALAEALYTVASDRGRVAAMAGYDGIRVEHKATGELRQAVVFNRSMLVVDEKHLWGYDELR
jgi:hypothetical protein